MNGVYGLVSFLQILIPLAAVPRVIYCLIYISMDNDQAASYKRRIRNLIVFVVLAECIGELILVIKNYY